MTNINSNQKLQYRPTAFEMFTGPGGLSLGLRSSGFHVVGAVEKVESCVKTYRRNHPETIVIHDDVRNITSEQVISIVLKVTGKKTVDLVAGGPPCETFSTAGPGIRKNRDYRDMLFQELIRIACVLKAKYILIENIPGLQTKKGPNGEKAWIFNEILKLLHDSGYVYYKWAVLNAANYGVPQFRERLFIIATSDSSLPIIFPTPTHGYTKLLPWNTVEDAIGDLPPLDNGEEKNFYLSPPMKPYQYLMRGLRLEEDVFTMSEASLISQENYALNLHRAPNHRPGTIERFKLIRPGEGLRDIMTRLDPDTVADLQKKKILPKSWYIQRNRRILLNEPSPTVTSHCLSELLHPLQNRHITPREAARLQSFPDWYYIEGPWVVPHIMEEQDKYEQIGDAVPPLLGYVIGKQLLAGLEGLEKTDDVNVSFTQYDQHSLGL
ncbi:BsaWI methylase [Oscillochloris trichoides DG-6]|uniref:Cytosine-specific methyltransferase n=1 Tax=Oscillochloris trichoides DG-6 TaxID=765420 RepID=E1I9Y1_9CHLR|nr:DNA cytosine methyltransferase [Oscillochloris trichoides]EFO81983.1 BsaWI methylase [Oscillochloris trichoides DG-6]